MFRKILIANRGEIACRIIRTCQRMGIRTVAVYSEADTQALHVEMADEACFIGPSAAQQSYLNSKSILYAAKISEAEAIHPGYGFLSENAAFAAAVEAAGMTFIGPPAKVIRQMGDKLQAKTLASRAGISLVPGSKVPLTNSKAIKAFANQFGYPLLLKAAAGGGGKGMRIVYHADQAEDLLQRASSEAAASFGDGRVFVEKYLENARHIEIQILADRYGNVVHLGERDCSLQRRHQKIIEECPSPFMTPDLRDIMTRQAVVLASQVGYISVGTIEFMVTPDHHSYFLEMNTRLQVEHPVTEMVTGLDLVEQMIRVAMGEPLRFTQKQISFVGHAIEARLYAEDANNDFLPSSGRLTRFDPILEEGLRLETSVVAGCDVSIFYDPMIAKVIAWAPDRHQAIKRLQKGLAQFVIEGPSHNRGFLEQLLHHPAILQGNFTTRFVEKGLNLKLSPFQKQLVKAIAALIYHRENALHSFGEWIVAESGKGVLVQINGSWVKVNQKNLEVDLHWQPGEKTFIANVQGEAYYGQARLSSMDLILTLFGVDHRVQVMRPPIWRLFSHIPPINSLPDISTIKAPMPGMLISLPVCVGDQVKKGQILLVIEAMKMENALKAPRDAVIDKIFVQQGDTLVRGQVLFYLKY